MISCSGARVSIADDGPISLRHIPGQFAVLELGRQVDDFSGVDRLPGGHWRRDSRIRQAFPLLNIHRRFGCEIGNLEMACGSRKGLNHDVLIVTVDRFRLGQRRLEVGGTMCGRLRVDHFLHRQRRRNPRAAAAAPARAVVHVDRQSEPGRFLARKFKKVMPCRTSKCHRPFGRSLVDRHDQHAADPDPLHRLQIGRDAFPRDVVIHPKPIDPRPGAIGRGSKIVGQVVGSRSRIGQGSDNSQRNAQNQSGR